MLLNIFPKGLEHNLMFKNLYDNYLPNNNNNKPNTSNDSLILIQDGVYFGAWHIKKSTTTKLNIYAIEIDVIARGLFSVFDDMQMIKLISYEEFIDLVIKHDKSITW
jgi:sulfur relay protein TusB/DsrH